ncbi:MAG TPA: ABC transporter permease subunit [Desulfurivibrio alkaliphilus]|uniref:ABC transporter permease subunit n=1 Tax=Desulfurivibrio alkaliphilus TaxID=427923 RepID=A0A7C2TH69_9BACT|nr:ABC transporter permease subunit [Desulfurivibrio alkaliphilus]
MLKNWQDRCLQAWLYFSILLVVGTALLTMGYILVKGWSAITLDFLFSAPRGMPLGKEGGVFPALTGSLALGLLSMLIASLLGLATALYQHLYCSSPRVYSLIRLVVQCIAGIPSIVLGLFGYTFFVVSLGLGHSLLAGGLTLSLMIFPVVAINTDKALTEVRPEQTLASYALGVPRSYTFFHIIWPERKNDIISGILLGTVYAMGATAPIMLTAAVLSAPSPGSLLRPVMALPYHLYILASERISMENAYGTALVLLLLLFAGYGAAFLLFGRRGEGRE